MFKTTLYGITSMKKPCIVFLILGLFFIPVHSQDPDYSAVQKMIKEFKTDERGPYQAIRWFCPDGSILPPKERCPEPGGIQHALAKDIVQKLAAEHRIFLGQILAGSGFEEFYDKENLNLRLQQYQMEKFLQANDDGWILRRARYYRGAIQAEDEEAWGREFLLWLLKEDEIINGQFFFLRQVVKDIPHQTNSDKWMSIRGLSKTISDSLPAFMNLRVKLHGQPEFEDIQHIETFYRNNQQKIPQNLRISLENLIGDLYDVYRESDFSSLASHLDLMGSTDPLPIRLKEWLKSYEPFGEIPAIPAEERATSLAALADMLWLARLEILSVQEPEHRLAYLDFSIDLEHILFQQAAQWKPLVIRELLEKNYTLAKALSGCGYLELWEWQTIEHLLNPENFGPKVDLKSFSESVSYARRVVEWGSSMVRTVYGPVIALFGKFEPLAQGFLDDRIRSSLLLSQGEVAGRMAEIMTVKSGIKHRIMNLNNQPQIHGLNPGFAFGELVVVPDDPSHIEFSARKIYFIQHAPPDMKPVAGIATVSEGNLVSHVQLLARNLGIPNAVIAAGTLTDLLPYSGKNIFYAVSPGGTVVLKQEADMSPEEKALIEEKKRSDERIHVPTNKLNLKKSDFINLADLRSGDSGKFCGPKAANLGQLKSLFPDNVVNGLAIPFGVFREHMDQTMAGSSETYWSYLQNTFKEATVLREAGKPAEEIEAMILTRFEQLREAIRGMPFLPGFQKNLADAFGRIFGAGIGEVPVFIRSDTNMEDLKDFTGAGLNLTVFNVREPEKIFKAIREVWASPYADRSYRWRQKYLLNPEDVYPSILIIPSVRVNKSGVLITTGIVSSNSEDLTVAFNRGAGGAVEGQMAESYLLENSGIDKLLSPSRERASTDLPETGGVQKLYYNFDNKILTSDNLKQLREFSIELKSKLKQAAGIGNSGPYDVELGFLDDKIWLFQVRPFVESKKAKSSDYLQSLSPQQNSQDHVLLNGKIDG